MYVLPALTGFKSAVFIKSFQFFQTSLQKDNFPWHKIKFPDYFLRFFSSAFSNLWQQCQKLKEEKAYRTSNLRNAVKVVVNYDNRKEWRQQFYYLKNHWQPIPSSFKSQQHSLKENLPIMARGCTAVFLKWQELIRKWG